MRLFWMKNKVLIATLLAVLVLGVAFWGGLRLFEGNEMQDVMVRTSFAEAEATPSPMPAQADGSPATAQPTAMPAALVSEDILDTEWKYKDIFPRITQIYSYQAKTWKEGDKVDDDLAEAARKKAKDIYYLLFNVGG